jgi:hypothetical protein
MMRNLSRLTPFWTKPETITRWDSDDTKCWPEEKKTKHQQSSFCFNLPLPLRSYCFITGTILFYSFPFTSFPHRYRFHDILSGVKTGICRISVYTIVIYSFPFHKFHTRLYSCIGTCRDGYEYNNLP